jgi:hypothetical protein
VRHGALDAESHCMFCPFAVISRNWKIAEIAEAAHDCPGMKEFRALQEQH